MSIQLPVTRSSIYCRYYSTEPAKKTLETCRIHGASHRAYGWMAQIDPRWDEVQQGAYLDEYEGRTSEVNSVL